jgi:RHS repeat-associated protein
LTYTAGDQLRQCGKTQYTYDQQGRLATKTLHADGVLAQWSYEWDAMDQLREVRAPDGSVHRYGYDALGRRVLKESNGATTRFLWDRHVILEVHRDKAIDETWIYGPQGFSPLATIQRDAVYSVVPDHSGCPRELVGTDGQLAWSARYRLWGAPDQISLGGARCSHRFAGQWCDEETGLHYTRYRYYDPETGRFISPDPLRVRGGFNLFSYARDPVNWVDPYGLATVYRGMFRNADGEPVVSSHTDSNPTNPAQALGVRTTDEGAMSSTRDPANLQEHRRNAAFGGTQGENPKQAPHGAGMFAIDDAVLAQHGLQAVDDNDTHTSIIPKEGKGAIPDAELAERLAATRDHWEEVTPEEVERRRQEAARGEGGCDG